MAQGKSVRILKRIDTKLAALAADVVELQEYWEEDTCDADLNAEEMTVKALRGFIAKAKGGDPVGCVAVIEKFAEEVAVR